MNKLKKRKLSLLALCTGSLALALGVLFASGKGIGAFFGKAGDSEPNYRITLDDKNKVTSAGDVTQHTAQGSDVVFNYANVANSTSGHVTLNNGGAFYNKTQITSISAITPVFSGAGSLKARIAYSIDNFNEYFSLTSNSRYEIGSNPYFLEVKADGGTVTVSSLLIEFTCVSNPDAGAQSKSGSYTITFAEGSGDGTTVVADHTSVDSVVASGEEYISEIESSDRTYYGGSNGLKVAASSNSGSITFGLANSVNVSTIVAHAKRYNSGKSGSLNVNSVGQQAVTSSFEDYIYNVNETIDSLTLAANKYIWVKSVTVNYDEESAGTPENPDRFETGFTAVDNGGPYSTNSIFDEANKIVVTVNRSDATSYITQNFTYSVIDPHGQEINTAEKFAEVGTYTLRVFYGNFVRVEIPLNVGEYIYVADVAASMEDVTFNTADKLSEHLSGNLTASVEYSNGQREDSIIYTNFTASGLGVKLLTPRGIVYDQSLAFGTAGTWIVRVYDLTNETEYYDISITVDAIPVETITFESNSFELYPEDELQLVPSVGPATATNKAIEWSSSNEDVATVNEEGLVTAVSVGGATISATAADGSNVFGSVVITVKARPVSADVDDELTNANTINEDTTSYTDWSATASSSAGYSGQSAGDGGTIQLRSNKSTSGIVATKSGGKIKKITVSWGSATEAGRTLNIYGKNTAYEDPTDLYGSSSGTLLGTIVKNTSTTFTITGDYTYVGVRSNSGAMYLNSITFTWSSESAAPVSPTYPTEINLTGNNSISIGETSQLSVGYTPSDTNVKNVTFNSSNGSVATVSTTGLVTGIAQGSATITATAEAKTGTVQATLVITVSPIAVTSVALDQHSLSVKVNNTITLVATVAPTNATNKNVTWSSSDTTIATVSSAGVVTGKAAGTATITVTTVDQSKTDKCVVTVSGSESGSFLEDVIDNATTVGDLGNTASSSWASNFTLRMTSGASYTVHSMGTKSTSNALQWNTNGFLYSTTSGGIISSVSAVLASGKSITVYGSNTAFSGNSGGTEIGTISGSNTITPSETYEYIRIVGATSGIAVTSITIQYGTPEPTDPTGIIMNPTKADISPNGSKQLSVSYVPSNANQNKELTWESSNTSVATVSSSGLVTVKSGATAGQKATITAKLTKFQSVTATCEITVVAQSIDDHTVLIYICGADLESDSQLATGDIQEMLSVSNQPNDVNIVIQTGGAKSWSSKYGINASKLQRWHVENRSLVKDQELSTYSGMGKSSTLQSFIEYGLNTYPAQRTGLVLWNHGGAMRGVCYDEKDGNDSLLNSEVKSAVSGALNNCSMSGQKLEWIGYDACLMQVQDVAEFNSNYFNYMIASEESESGYGWDYDTWVDDLYAKKSTTTILKAVVDGFITSNGGTSSSKNDQTLSYLDLSKMAAYKTAWETMASTINSLVKSYTKSKFQTLLKTCKYYGSDSECEGYSYFGIFDAKDVLNKLIATSAFSSASTQLNEAKAAFEQLVAYSSCGKGAGNSYGLCCFFPMKDGSGYTCNTSSVYTTSQTTFTNWRSIVTSYGD